MTTNNTPLSPEQSQALRLVMTHQAFVTAYARAICGDPILADDAAQEVALAIVSKPDRLPDPETERAWIKAVTRNKVLQYLRQQRRSTALAAETLAALADEVAEAVDHREPMRLALGACVAELDERSQALLQARFLQGQDCATIADQWTTGVQAIYARLKRLKAALRLCVERQLAESQQ